MIPENWRWVRLGDVYRINPKNSAGGNTLAAFVPMEKISPGMTSAFSFEVQPWDKAKKGHTQFADGDVAFAKISPCFENRKSFLARGLPNGIGGGTTELIVLRQPLVDPRYTFWLISDERFIAGGLRTYSGTVGQQRISMDYVRNYEIPLPPFPEQQRIAARIESLFARLDEAADKLRAVVDGSELRRAAILHRAFTGELTAKWREEHGVSLKSWRIKPLCEVACLQTGLMKGKRYEGETAFLPYLRVANVQDGFLDLSEVKKIEVGIANIARYSLQRGDVLFTEGGDFDKLGRGTVWEGEIPNCLHQNHIFAVRPAEDTLNPYFLSYQAGSGYGKAYFLRCSKQTTNLASINSTQLKKFPVKLPSLQEQSEIVSVVNRLFSIENQSIAIQQISKECQRQKTNLRSPMDESTRKPQQYHAEAGVKI